MLANCKIHQNVFSLENSQFSKQLYIFKQHWLPNVVNIRQPMLFVVFTLSNDQLESIKTPNITSFYE